MGDGLRGLKAESKRPMRRASPKSRGADPALPAREIDPLDPPEAAQELRVHLDGRALAPGPEQRRRLPATAKQKTVKG